MIAALKIVPALCLLGFGGCDRSSDVTIEHANAVTAARLSEISNATPDGAGADPDANPGGAVKFGERMRSAAAKPPPQ